MGTDLKSRLYSCLPKMKLDELYGYITEIEMGYIKADYHPEDDNIVILNYTKLTTFEKRWNKYTMSARGLILDLTDVMNNGNIYVLAKAFDKFPNYGLNEINGYEDDIDFSETPVVIEKMDGSLGISYFFNNEIRFATRGSFNSKQALKATEIWRKKYAKYEDLEIYSTAPVTYLVEIIYPENRVVVDYKGKEDLVMIGTILLFSDNIKDADYDHVKWEAERLKMPIATQYYLTIDKLLEIKRTLSANEEGFIIRYSNGKRLKIKGDEYLNVHGVLYGLSDKAKVGAWAENRMQEYIMILPEEFRKELEELTVNLDRILHSLKDTLTFMFMFLFEKSCDRKSFAIYVNSTVDKPYRKFMFNAYDKGVVSEDLIREYIYKNYTDYMELIRWEHKTNQDS